MSTQPSKKAQLPASVFKTAAEHARGLSEWSKRSFESRKPFGYRGIGRVK